MIHIKTTIHLKKILRNTTQMMTVIKIGKTHNFVIIICSSGVYDVNGLEYLTDMFELPGVVPYPDDGKDATDQRRPSLLDPAILQNNKIKTMK